MPTRSISPNKQWSGIHPGKYGGNVWDTWNIDLERNPNAFRLSNKMRRFTTVPGLLHKLIRTDADTTDQWWGMVNETIGDGELFKNGNNSISGGTWAADDLSNSPGDAEDMIVHESANGEERLVVVRRADIAILNLAGAANVWTASWWQGTLSQSALFSSYHCIGKLQKLLAIGDVVNSSTTDVPVIHTIDKDDVVQTSRLVFRTNFTVRSIMSSSDRFWIALHNNRSGGAIIIEWDGFSLTYNNEYKLVGDAPINGFIVDNIPYFITDVGYIYKFIGGSFKVVQSFHLNEDQQQFSASFEEREATIGVYGSDVDRHLVYLLVGFPIRPANTTGTGLTGGAHRGRSGIWVYNTKTNNLYHLMGLGEHASAGTDQDYGHGLIKGVGTVKFDNLSGNTLLFASANVYTGGANWNSGGQEGLYREILSQDQSSSAGRNRGWIKISRIPIGEVDALWEGLWIKFRRFVNSGNRIIVKWRTVETPRDEDASDDSPIQAEGTWASTTTFTCVVPTGVAVGDEVEPLTGDNAGCSFNISALSATPDGSTTITVTIDEAAPNSSTDTFVARFENWRSQTAISSTTVGNQFVPLTRSSTANSGTTQGEWIDLKIELRGFSVEIDDLIAKYKVNTDPNQR